MIKGDGNYDIVIFTLNEDGRQKKNIIKVIVNSEYSNIVSYMKLIYHLSMLKGKLHQKKQFSEVFELCT